jgi:hypothetical protein
MGRKFQMKNQTNSQSWPMNQAAWMTTATAAWWAKGSEHQSEMLDFMSHRLSKASEAVRELGKCRNWENASDVHSRWIEDTLTDYSAQSTKVAAINVKQGAEAVQGRQRRH